MERLTDPAQGYCEMYCKKYGRCFGDPGDCTFEKEKEMYQKLKDIEGIVSFDRLVELAFAERAGRCVVFFAKPGQEVWVVERDEIGNPDCVSGFVFMAEVGGFVIVHPFLGECGDIDEILNNCAEETARNYSCDVSVFPIDDCFGSYEAAEAAMKSAEATDVTDDGTESDASIVGRNQSWIMDRFLKEE